MEAVDARCAADGLPVVGTCRRCGAFICEKERELVVGGGHCRVCAARPDVNSELRYRARSWGKRDGFAYFFVLFGIANVLGVLRRPGASAIDYGDVALLMLTHLAYFFGLKPARYALPVVHLFRVGLFIWVMGVTAAIANPIGFAVIGCVALFSTRNAMFFRVPVSDERLRSAHRKYNANAIATYGMVLSLCACGCAPLGFLGMAFGIQGLVRCLRPEEPRLPGLWPAIIGTVAGPLCAAMNFVVLYNFFSKR